MAARKTPSGGSKPDKLLRDALLIELNRAAKNGKGKKFNFIAAKLLEAAEDGKLDAIKELWNRIEGLPAQAVEATHSGKITIGWES